MLEPAVNLSQTYSQLAVPSPQGHARPPSLGTLNTESSRGAAHCPVQPGLPSARGQQLPWGSQLTSMSGVSSRNLLLTDTRASSGHSWNQSMAVQLTTAGNLLARTRRVEPTGEKQSTTWGRTAVPEWGVPPVSVCGGST